MGVLTFWNACGIVDKRVHSTRQRIIMTTEDASLSVVVAASGLFALGGAAGAPRKDGAEDDSSKGKKGTSDGAGGS